MENSLKEYYENIDKYPYAKRYFEINEISVDDVIDMANNGNVPVTTILLNFDMDIQHEVQCGNIEL